MVALQVGLVGCLGFESFVVKAGLYKEPFSWFKRHLHVLKVFLGVLGGPGTGPEGLQNTPKRNPSYFAGTF